MSPQDARILIAEAGYDRLEAAELATPMMMMIRRSIWIREWISSEASLVKIEFQRLPLGWVVVIIELWPWTDNP